MDAARKVMLLDDNIMDVMEAEDYLREGGYDVVTLSSPNGALSKIEYERPEILLLDLHMPRLNTQDLIDTLRASEEYEDMVIVLFRRGGRAAPGVLHRARHQRLLLQVDGRQPDRGLPRQLLRVLTSGRAALSGWPPLASTRPTP